MASLGTLAALPARPATFDYASADTQTYIPSSPYTATLKAQSMPEPLQPTTPPAFGTEFIAVQVLLMLGAMLVLLRAAPPAPVVIDTARQALAAALARSRTRSTIARSPFDL